MAQSALTVTTPNPTPPTNFSFTGVTGPNPPNYTRQSYQTWVGVGNTGPNGVYNTPSNTNPPPFYDDGSGGTATVFAANTAALTGGTSANDTGTGTTISAAATGAGGEGVNSAVGTYGGSVAASNTGLVPASTSVAHEGAGTETLFTQTYSSAIYAPVVLTTVGCGPNLVKAVTDAGAPVSPNQTHASSLSPAFASNPTLTTISPTTSVHGTGAITMTATGTNFTRQSKIAIAGVPQNTTFVSATSLTCLATPPLLAGTNPAVTVVTGGAVVTAPQTWTTT